ncbi:MAG: DsbC family protein [Hydrogenophaga sp.]|nr:DsbC family protein [Hydrogenophaga sp.]
MKLTALKAARAIALALPIAATLFASATHAGEAEIRKNLKARLADMPPIMAVAKTPVPGIFEVVLEGNHVVYSDSNGDHFFEGTLINTKTKANLTQEKADKLNVIKFSDLDLKDSFTVVKGTGAQKFALFTDPNCGFCKRFEGDLMKLDNVTIHVFLYPILGQDSITKSNNIWCAKDKAKSYYDWMHNGTVPPAATCDTAAVERNVAFGKKYAISGTPTTFFVDGSRLPGAYPLEELKKRLVAAK